MGIVPRSISTIKEWREPSANWRVVELCARAVDIAGVKEPQKAVVSAVERATNERGDMGGFEEAVTRKLTHDVHVVVSETEGGRFRRTAEPRPTGRGDKRLRVHADNYIGVRCPRGCGAWGKGAASMSFEKCSFVSIESLCFFDL